jgi:hypothetical protein
MTLNGLVVTLMAGVIDLWNRCGELERTEYSSRCVGIIFRLRECEPIL